MRRSDDNVHRRAGRALRRLPLWATTQARTKLSSRHRSPDTFPSLGAVASPAARSGSNPGITTERHTCATREPPASLMLQLLHGTVALDRVGDAGSLRGNRGCRANSGTRSVRDRPGGWSSLASPSGSWTRRLSCAPDTSFASPPEHVHGTYTIPSRTRAAQKRPSRSPSLALLQIFVSRPSHGFLGKEDHPQ